MNEADIMAIITEVLRDVLDEPKLVVTPATTAKDVDGWDSITHIELIATLQKRFGVKFTLAEVQGIANVGELARCVLAKRG